MNMKKKRSCLLGAIACILLMGCDALTDVYAPDVV